MSSNPLAQADFWAGAPDDSEYDVLYAAVTATERGRWFLTEYAHRNRYADTQLLTNALARIEAAVLGEAPVPAANGTAAPSVTFADMTSFPAEAAPAVAESAPMPPVRNESVAAEKADETSDDAPAADLFATEWAGDEKFAEAIAALASSLTLLSKKEDQPAVPPTEKEDLGTAIATDNENQAVSDPQSRLTATIIPAPDYTETAAAPPLKAEPVPVPRWYIEPPDFVFRAGEPKRDAAEVEPPGQPEFAHSLQFETQLPPGPQEDPADLFESSPGGVTTAQDFDPAPTDRPQLKIANGPTAWPLPRPSLNDPLAGVRALSEEELIALFG
jgi:hypothetical protein